MTAGANHTNQGPEQMKTDELRPSCLCVYLSLSLLSSQLSNRVHTSCAFLHVFSGRWGARLQACLLSTSLAAQDGIKGNVVAILDSM